MLVLQIFNQDPFLLVKHRTQQPLGSPFDPKIHESNAQNAFYLVAKYRDEWVVHTQAMRVLNLQLSTLEDHLLGSFRSLPLVGPDIDFAASPYRAGPSVQKISGVMCYQGELWMDDTVGAFRGRGLSAVLGRFAFLTCLMRLSPDYIFGFVARLVIFKGLAERMGYMHTEPSCIRWRQNDSDLLLEGFMVWMSRVDLKFVMTIQLLDLAA